MKYDKKPLFILLVYVMAMLFVCVFSVLAINKAKKNDSDGGEATTSATSVYTQMVYITVAPQGETVSSGEVTTAPTPYWKVCEYEKKIGIFLRDGTLYDVLDVYVKTLPEADRRMLGEGIIIESEEALRSIIEDYTG